MVETTRTSKLAVIITTHYIDEARLANSVSNEKDMIFILFEKKKNERKTLKYPPTPFHQIGMMRNGILLAEDTPTNIMLRFNCDNLEDAFLVLCQKHGSSEEADTTISRASGQKFSQNVSIQMQQSSYQSTDCKSDGKVKETKECEISKHDSGTQTDIPSSKGKLKRNLSFHEQRPNTLLGKLTFTSQIRMKALLTKNLLQLIRQPS